MINGIEKKNISVKELKKEGRYLNAALYTPKTEPGKTYPLVLFLHGAGERGDDLNLVLDFTPGADTFMTDAWQAEHPCFVLAPQCPENLPQTILVCAKSGIAAVHVKPGDTVEVGDLLFELVDAQSAKNASRSVAADASGVITLMNTVSGAQVYRGQLLCEVADMSALELSAEVDELDLNSVAVGDTLTYTLDTFEGETFVGTVTKIYAVGTKKQNATYFDVRITLPSGKALLPGMNGTVTINK